MKTQIRRIVVDSLEPRETSTIELSKSLCEADGVGEVDLVVTEVDSRTETIKITIRGQQINYDAVMKVMDDHGATIRSIDEINVGRAPAPSR